MLKAFNPHTNRHQTTGAQVRTHFAATMRAQGLQAYDPRAALRLIAKKAAH